MALKTPLQGIMDWLLKGYPTGVPPKDYIPLLALLRRRLTEGEVREIAGELSARADGPAGATVDDIGVSITKITNAMPSPQDVARVEDHLNEYHDWPLETS
ncbi:MAG: DUF3349 domain-containing protein [Actinomycetota bacterium]|nr:DUF3349 domain-containing protein [Actinomycetota bacterium]